MSILPETLNKLHQELAEKQTKESAWDIIDEYFSFFGLESIHHELWLLTAGTLSNEEMQFAQRPVDRSNLIFFFEFSKMFYEAVYLLHSKHNEKKPAWLRVPFVPSVPLW